MSIVQLNSDNLTLEKLLKALTNNESEYNRMKSEIKKLEEIELKQIAHEVSGNNLVRLIDSDDEVDEYDDEFSYDETLEEQDEDIQFYIDKVKGIKVTKENNLYNDIKEALPSKSDYNFERVLTEIKLELLKENTEIEKLLHDCDDKEILEEFKNDLILNNLKMQEIQKISEEELTEEETKEKNRLIFVPTPGGNIRVIEDLKGIDRGKYEFVLKLLDSIKDGTFKGFRRFKNNNRLKGICEVRDRFNNVRIVYKRLVNNNYAIISVFIKSSTSEAGYRPKLFDKIDKFNCIEEELKSKLKIQKFLEVNKMYEQEIYNILTDGKYLEEPTIDSGKKKGGDSNDE